MELAFLMGQAPYYYEYRKSSLQLPLAFGITPTWRLIIFHCLQIELPTTLIIKIHSKVIFHL